MMGRRSCLVHATRKKGCASICTSDTDGEARDDVAEEHIWKEAEAVEVDDVVERGG